MSNDPAAWEASLSELETKIGHVFRNRELLVQALTHRSFVHETRSKGSTVSDNERLEFLGDAVLNVTCARLLFTTLADAAEGDLSRRRAELVRESSLAYTARELGLADMLRLGRGEERTGGRTKPRLLASAVEAILAAVMLDTDLSVAMNVASTVLVHAESSLREGPQDFKTPLQERLQAQGRPAPRYAVIDTQGPAHDPIFVIQVSVDGQILAEGRGRSKTEAEQQAAARALVALDAPAA